MLQEDQKPIDPDLRFMAVITQALFLGTCCMTGKHLTHDLREFTLRNHMRELEAGAVQDSKQHF